MDIQECQSQLDKLSEQLEAEIKSYNQAIDQNAGYTKRKEIRLEMRRIDEEMVQLQKLIKTLKPQC